MRSSLVKLQVQVLAITICLFLCDTNCPPKTPLQCQHLACLFFHDDIAANSVHSILTTIHIYLSMKSNMRRFSFYPFLASLVLIYSTITSAISIDCSDIVVDKKQFNLKVLEGPHALYTVRKHLPTITNTTFTIDICRPLEKTKGVPKGEDCPNGSRGNILTQSFACGIPV